jgi:hypothetical protein
VGDEAAVLAMPLGLCGVLSGWLSQAFARHNHRAHLRGVLPMPIARTAKSAFLL